MEYWIHWLTLHEIRTSPELRNGVVSRQQHVLSCPEHCPSGQRRHRRPLLRWIQRIQEVRIAQRGQLAERSGLNDIQRLRDTIPGEICQLEYWMDWMEAREGSPKPQSHRWRRLSRLKHWTAPLPQRGSPDPRGAPQSFEYPGQRECSRNRSSLQF